MIHVQLVKGYNDPSEIVAALEMEVVPRTGEMVVIDGVKYECLDVHHSFTSTGRRSWPTSYNYVAQVRVTPL